MRVPDPAVNAGDCTLHKAFSALAMDPACRGPLRCVAGPNPCFGVGPMDVAGPHETIVAEFFPAAAPPRAISRVDPGALAPRVCFGVAL